MNDTTAAAIAPRDARNRNAMSTATAEYQRNENHRESNRMLIHEELARSRMRDYQRQADHDRVVKRLVAARRWDRIAAWSARRALAAHRRLS